MRTMTKDYDYLLKVLLVGDSDVGKHEILSNLEDPSTESPFCSGNGKYIQIKNTYILNKSIMIYIYLNCTTLTTYLYSFL